MKGAKGGNRDRIISWLFSEKNRKIREENQNIEKEEEIKNDQKTKERRKSKKPNITEENVIEVTPIEETEEIVSLIDGKKEEKDRQIEDLDVTLIDIFDTNHDKNKEQKKDTEKDEDKNKKPPTLFIDEEIVEEIKEKNKSSKEEKDDEIREVKDKDKDEQEIKISPLIDDNKESEIKPLEENEPNISHFPEVSEVTIEDNDKISNIEKPELIQISIIEEIDTLLLNDSYDLRDLKYQIEVLNQQEKDEVLLENIEKIQKELELLIKRFEEIKKKYEHAYTTISIKDISFINDLNLGISISDYITTGKNGNLDDSSINQIDEIKEFIAIINNIIEIEVQKDMVKESVDEKLVDYSIRDDDFIKLQNRYANVEGINSKIDKYNNEINSVLKDMEEKLANSVDITKRIETTTSIVPDINRMIKASVLMASTNLIPPTPFGNLFRTTMLLSAAHMMATAFTPKTEEKEIIKTTVTDYSRDILNNKDSIKNVLDNIENAFDEISYMKDTFEKEFSQFKDQIPGYDELIKNIFSIEKELTRQQDIAYEYSNKIDHALNVNNQKVKKIEE